MNNLQQMKQYPIERDLFCKIFKKPYLKYEEKWNVEVITDNFMLRYHDDEYWLLHKPSGTIINWYKHLGRCLEVNKDLTIDEYKYLADLWYDDLLESGE